MGDAPPRMVDPTVLLPVVLLVVAEFSTLARDLDVRAAVAEGRPPLVVDFVVHGTLTYPAVVRRRAAAVLAPSSAVLRERTAWTPSVPKGPSLPVRVRKAALTAQTVLLPNLGQFGIIHLTNVGLLVFTFAATTSSSGMGPSFAQYLLAFVVVALPLLEVGEYDTIQTAVDPVYSFAFHLAVNVGIVAIAVPPCPVIDARFARAPLLAALPYAAWWLGAGYLYLVVLAVDIRRTANHG